MQQKQNNQERKGLRLWMVALLCLLLLGAAGFVHSFDTGGETEINKSLEFFPKEIGQWQARNDMRMSDREAAMLGVDDYSFRDYSSPDGGRINFYASFFGANNQEKGFHSPLNCMPGSGWDIASTENVSLQLPDGREVQVRKMLLVRGSDYQISLYWYHCRSRIIASEYWERVYRVLDSIRYSRTDGAFIRLIATGSDADGQALEKLKDFASQVIPLLDEHLPGV